MNFDGIVIIDSNSGLPLYSKLESIDENLFSGFLTAISSFSKELSLGGISSFVTEEKSVYLIARSRVIVSLIVSKEVQFNDIYSFGYIIGEKFEKSFDLSKSIINTSEFSSFDSLLESIIKEDEKPFLIRVADFVRKEFGGEISVNITLKNNYQKDVKIDLISDRGEKKHQGVFGTIAKKMLKSFSEDITFIKVIEGTAGRGEVLDFFELTKTFGKVRHKKDEDIFPYFPSKAVVIAKEFSPTVFDEINKFSTFDDKKVIAGTHISPDAGMKGAPKTMKCFIELWKWKDSDYPERLLN